MGLFWVLVSLYWVELRMVPMLVLAESVPKALLAVGLSLDQEEEVRRKVGLGPEVEALEVVEVLL